MMRGLPCVAFTSAHGGLKEEGQATPLLLDGLSHVERPVGAEEGVLGTEYVGVAGQVDQRRDDSLLTLDGHDGQLGVYGRLRVAPAGHQPLHPGRGKADAGRLHPRGRLGDGLRCALMGVNLNLNFPSVVGTVQVGDREVEYGYSPGIYAKYVSALTPIRSAPTQDEIDALSGGKTTRDWEARFELAYEKCRDQNVTLVGGATPPTLRFARYLRQL